jgi:hypothetical protein
MLRSHAPPGDEGAAGRAHRDQQERRSKRQEPLPEAQPQGHVRLAQRANARQDPAGQQEELGRRQPEGRAVRDVEVGGDVVVERHDGVLTI